MKENNILKNLDTIIPLIFFIFLFLVGILIYFEIVNFFGEIEQPETIITTVMQVLAAIFSIIIGATFIALELASHLYSPRLIKFCITRPYFLMMISLFLIALLYSGFILGYHLNLNDGIYNETQNSTNFFNVTVGYDNLPPQFFDIDYLLLIFIINLFFIVPYLLLYFSDLHPASSKLSKYLCKEISLKNTVNIIKEKSDNNEEVNLFESINEIVMTAFLRYDYEIIKKYINEISGLYINMILNLNKSKNRSIIKQLKEASISHYFKKNAFNEYVNQAFKSQNEDLLKFIIQNLKNIIYECIKNNENYLNNNKNDEISNILDDEFIPFIDIIDNIVKRANEEKYEQILKIGVRSLKQIQFKTREYNLVTSDYIKNILEEDLLSEQQYPDLVLY